MTTTITIEEATAKLSELIDGLAYGDVVVITKDGEAVAKLTGERVNRSRGPRPGPGFGKGQVLYMAPDFDGPMEEFKKYEE